MRDLAGASPRAILPTTAPSLSGKSLVPAFAKDTAIERDFLYFHHNKNRAIRIGDHQLVAIGEKGPLELHNLAKDRAEQTYLAEKRRQLVQNMANRWQQTEDSFVKAREAARPTRMPTMNSPAQAG